ncbi:hypothetical protein EAE96_003560 [Botrytis aclada]|nr:hypothetical protein EAE96_003560 [Botrytis aclada]
MSSYYDDGDVHYSEKVGTAEQQKHATRTYTYKSCRRGDKDDESHQKHENKIRIQVRNISWSSIRASLVRKLIGDIYDRNEAQPRADKEKLFRHYNASHTIKWTVDQRNNIAQLYTYDVDGEGRPGDCQHPHGIWMQYITLLGSGYVFNATSNSNAREDILNKARELFLYRKPHPKTIEGDWTYVGGNGEKYKLDERKHLDRWTDQEEVDDLPWLARARVGVGVGVGVGVRTEKTGSGVTLPYKFRDYDLQVLNACKVELDMAILDNLFLDYFSTDPHAKKWVYWRITEGRNGNGRTNFSISRYHPTCKKMPYHTSGKKKVWITNYTADQNYQTVHDRLESTSAFNTIVQDESHWKLDWDKEKGRLTLEEMSNGKSKGREHSRPRSRYKRPENKTGNESSGSTSGDEILGVEKIHSHRSMPSPFPGYTHSLVESQNPEMTWSGRPEPSNPLFIGIHKKDRTVRYYGYNLTNSTRFGLWWDEIADLLLSKKIIKPPSAKGPKEKGRLIEEGNMIMIQFDPGSVSPKAEDSCTHERYMVKTYSLFEYKNSTTVDEQYPSISIRNSLRNKVAYKSILRGLGELLKETGGDVILAKNKGEIWQLIQKSDETFLSKPNSTQLRITIHPLAKRQRDTSSSGCYTSSDEAQRSRRPESHSAHRRSPSVSSRDNSNQDRTPTSSRYRPRSTRSLALLAHEGHIRTLPDYIRSREQDRAATSDSSSGEEQDISFFKSGTANGGGSTSSTHSRAQTQTEEPKERGRKFPKFNLVRNVLNSDQRYDKIRDKNLEKEKEWEEKMRKKHKRKEEKEKDKIEKKQKREKEMREREWRMESRKSRDRGDHSDWAWNYERGERARKPPAHRTLKFEVSFERGGR